MSQFLKLDSGSQFKTRTAPSNPPANYSYLYAQNVSGQISPVWHLTNGTTYNLLTGGAASGVIATKEGYFIAVNTSRFNNTLNWTNSFTSVFSNDAGIAMSTSQGCVNVTLSRFVVDYRCNLQNTVTTSTTNTFLTVSLYRTNSTSGTWTQDLPTKSLSITAPSSSNDYKSLYGRTYYYEVGTTRASNWTCYRLYGQHSAASFVYSTIANECSISVREVK